MIRQATVVFFAAGALAFAANSNVVKLKPILKGVEAQPQPATDEPLTDGSKTVHVSDRDIVPIRARLRFQTIIILPEDETILDFACGDKEFWPVDGAQNIASIKPAKAGASTNLNLTTASGHVYSFLLTEVGESSAHDMKIFIERKDGAWTKAGSGSVKRPRFVAVEELDDYRAQVQLAKAETARARQDAEREVEAAHKKLETEVRMARAAMPGDLKFEYHFDKQPVFAVEEIFNNGQFTFIKATPQETPVIYEFKDGKENLIEFQYANGLFTVPKILERFKIVIGKKAMHVTREVKKT